MKQNQSQRSILMRTPSICISKASNTNASSSLLIEVSRMWALLFSVVLVAICPSKSVNLQCAPTDYWCMNAVSLEYVNLLRHHANVTQLRMGTYAMVKHALTPEYPVGCYTSMVTKSVTVVRPSKNPALCCIKRFATSKSHYKRMISTEMQYFVMGIRADSKRLFKCTQIFSHSVKYGKASCKMAPTVKKILRTRK